MNNNSRRDDKFKKLFLGFFPSLYAFTFHLVRERETARDITQEVFLRAYRKWELFEFRDATKAFLYVTAKNLCIDYFKKCKTVQTYASGNRPEEYIEAHFLSEMTRQETFRILHAAIQELPDNQREVIRLSLMGDTVGEIARKMGISVNTVKTHKKQAYVFLREKMAHEYYLILLLVTHLII